MKLALFVFATVVVAIARSHPSPLQQAPLGARAKANPFEGSERARMAGAKLYHEECAACHGKRLEGIGNAPPLATPVVAHAAPGAIDWVLRNGSLRSGMPSFAHLPQQQRWQIITYLQ